MPKRNTLDRLREQEAKVKAAIRDAEKREAKRAAEVHTMKCTIIGAALSLAMEQDKALEAQLNPIIGRYVTKPRERKLLGLSPINKAQKTENETA